MNATTRTRAAATAGVVAIAALLGGTAAAVVAAPAGAQPATQYQDIQLTAVVQSAPGPGWVD